jgi:hypothetical protein
MMTLLQRPTVSTAFNRFLYAGVGDDKNGMELTLLSVFARQDVDPWEQAADLSRLPGEAAIRVLATLLDALPGQESLDERRARAARLIVLLPQPAEIRRSETPPRAKTPHRGGQATGLAMVVIYFASMLIGAWWFGTHAPLEDATQPVTAGRSGSPAEPGSASDGAAGNNVADGNNPDRRPVTRGPADGGSRVAAE